MLTLDRVTKTFRTGTFSGQGVTAVDRVSFGIAPGEVVTLIGESGSGKSTIGRMILGLTQVSEGSLTLDGEPVRSARSTTAASRACSRTRSAASTRSSERTASSR